MFILHTSNRTEDLARNLAFSLVREDPPSLFTKEIFLIQSRGMERMLAQYLSEVFGVWCNSDYLLPLQFIDYLSKRIGLKSDGHVFERELLTWQLEALLRDTNDPALKPLSAYLAGDQPELKRYQLARTLAHVFDQYQIMRMDILEAWEAGNCITGDDSEFWQKELWIRLRRSWPEMIHRGELIAQLIETLGKWKSDRTDLPARVFVFGLHTMPPLFLSALNTLSAKIDVHLFLLSPCELYWGDIESRRARARRIIAAGPDQSGELVGTSEFHPLLERLGRQGAHFQELLLDRVDYHEGAALFFDPGAESSTLLSRLQADILAGVEGAGDELQPGPEDTSIQVVSCHSRMRELMVLKDHILSRLHDDHTRNLHEIIVMAPDIQQYALLIPAVFEDIQHTIADRRVRKKNRYFDGFMQFLSLFSGRYGWTEIFSLLECPEISSRFEMSGGDLERIRHWIVETGIRWGLSVSQRREDNLIERDAGTWRSGLERMLMGYAIDSEEMVDGIFPFSDIEGGDSRLLAGLYSFVDIVDQGYQCFKGEWTLRDWSGKLQSFCFLLFGDTEHPDLLQLSRILAELQDTYSGYHDLPVCFPVIEAWLESAAENQSSGGFLNGKLTFCSMLPMRSIPFRDICLLGLNEGEYPKQDYFPTFDLMGKEYRHGDRSNRSDDRYQFLEAIISARECLYLSYIGQSIKTNKKIPPSVVVTELLECLRDCYGVRTCVVHHPLQASNEQYFTENSSLYSYDEHSCRVASNLRQKRNIDRSLWLQESIPEIQSHYGFSELFRFFGQPQVYFVRDVMGINFRSEPIPPEDEEMFRLDGLQRYHTENQILEGLLKESDEQSLLVRLQSESRWPLGTPGDLFFSNTVNQLKPFVERLNELHIGNFIGDLGFSVPLESITVEGVLSHCFEHGQLFYYTTKMKGKYLLTTYLYHLFATMVRNRLLPTYLFTEDQTIVFGEEIKGGTDLSRLIKLFLEGNGRPSRLLVEPAYVYSRQLIRNRERGRKDPVVEARALFSDTMEKRYVPEWNLLYRDQSVEDVIDQEFEVHCHQLMVPVLESAQVIWERG